MNTQKSVVDELNLNAKKKTTIYNPFLTPMSHYTMYDA